MSMSCLVSGPSSDDATSEDAGNVDAEEEKGSGDVEVEGSGDAEDRGSGDDEEEGSREAAAREI